MSKPIETEMIQANLVVRSIDSQDALFFSGVSTLIADYFESINMPDTITTTITAMSDTGLILHASEKPFQTSDLTRNIRSLDEPLVATCDTFAFRRYPRGGQQLTMQFKSESLYDEIDKIEQYEGAPSNLPAAAKMTLATITLNSTVELPIFDPYPINAAIIKTGVIDAPVTFAPAHYF